MVGNHMTRKIGNIQYGGVTIRNNICIMPNVERIQRLFNPNRFFDLLNDPAGSVENMSSPIKIYSNTLVNLVSAQTGFGTAEAIPVPTRHRWGRVLLCGYRMLDQPSQRRVAYLTGLYPAVSHTFILREIEALKALGLDIRPFSMRQPPASHLTGAPEKKAFDETFYVLKSAKDPVNVVMSQIDGLKTPGCYFGALKLAWSTSAPGFRAHLRQLIYFAEATILARQFKAQGITHLHNHFADVSANVAMLAAHLADIPFSYTLHGPAELYEPLKWALSEKTKRAKFVACISHFARSQAMYFSDPAHWDKLAIIHCGIEPALYDRPKTTKGDGKTRLLFVGRLTAIKGLRVLLDAFTKAHADNPNLHLTLIGDGDDRAHLEQLAAPLGDAVHFAGYQSTATTIGLILRPAWLWDICVWQLSI